MECVTHGDNVWKCTVSLGMGTIIQMAYKATAHEAIFYFASLLGYGGRYLTTCIARGTMSQLWECSFYILSEMAFLLMACFICRPSLVNVGIILICCDSIDKGRSSCEYGWTGC